MPLADGLLTGCRPPLAGPAANRGGGVRHCVPCDDRVLPRPRRRRGHAAAAFRRLVAGHDARGTLRLRDAARPREPRGAARARRPSPARVAVRAALELHALRRPSARRSAHDHDSRSEPRRAHVAAQRGGRCVHGRRARALAEPAIRAAPAATARQVARARRQGVGACRLVRADPPCRRRARDVRRRASLVPTVGRRSRAGHGQRGAPGPARARLRAARVMRAGDGRAALVDRHALRDDVEPAMARERLCAPAAPAGAIFREAPSRRRRLALPVDRCDSTHGHDGRPSRPSSTAECRWCC